MTRSKLIGLAAFVALTTISGARANTIVNGSFENPVISYPFYENYGPGCLSNCASGALPGWTVTTNNVDVVSQVGGFPAPAADGVQYLDLVGFGSTGGISQTFATDAGTTYKLSFAYGNNPGSLGLATATVNVTPFSSSSVTLPSLLTANFSTTSDIGWQTFIALFVATSGSTTLNFEEVIGGNNGGVLLDAINVIPTPLPAALPLFATGLGALGLLGWRRKRKAAALCVN